MRFKKSDCFRLKVDERAFSLIEVILATGVFFVTILVLVGLLGPVLKSVDEVEAIDEVVSVVSTLNAFLQNSPAIETTGQSKFEVLYGNIVSGDQATIYVFRAYLDDTSADTIIRVGFEEGEVVGDVSSLINRGDFRNAAGPIFRCVLTVSSVTPPLFRSEVRNSAGVYSYALENVDDYIVGYVAVEIRIFNEEPVASGGAFLPVTDLADLVGVNPIFTYNTAVVR